MSDLVKIARQRVDDSARTHWEGCERDHRECLIQRMADEIERLREFADTLVRERNAAWAESAELRADAARFVWWFSDTHKSGEFIAEYLRLMRAHATLDEWRAAIDAAMEAK